MTRSRFTATVISGDSRALTGLRKADVGLLRNRGGRARAGRAADPSRGGRRALLLRGRRPGRRRARGALARERPDRSARRRRALGSRARRAGPPGSRGLRAAAARAPRRLALRRLLDPNEPGSLSHRLRERRFGRFAALAAGLPRPLRVLDLGGTNAFWERVGWVGRDDVAITLVNLEEEPRLHPNVEPVAGDATDLAAF